MTIDNVIAFPSGKVRSPDEQVVKKKLCLDCEHCYVGPRGLFCGMFAEPIIYDDIAEECSEFSLI